jgi:UBX domain-containing protein 1
MESEGQEPNPNDGSHPNNDDGDGREAIITAFREITSATREEAIFFLEIHKFDLDAAVSTILDDVVTTTNNNKDNDNNENANDDTDAVVAQSLPSDPESPEYCPTPSRSRSPSPSPSRAAYELRSRREKKEKKKKRKNDGPSHGRRITRGNVRTLSDLKRPARDESDSDDSDEPQEYYTGGEKRYLFFIRYLFIYFWVSVFGCLENLGDFQRTNIFVL